LFAHGVPLCLGSGQSIAQAAALDIHSWAILYALQNRMPIFSVNNEQSIFLQCNTRAVTMRLSRFSQQRGHPMAATKTTTDYTDFSRRAFAPATRFNEVMVGNIERIARFQYELAGDLMQFSLDQLNATVKAKDLPTLLSKQREIATKFAEKATTRQQALAEMATESQAGLARWIEDATSLASGKAA
jgi:phasin family protein